MKEKTNTSDLNSKFYHASQSNDLDTIESIVLKDDANVESIHREAWEQASFEGSEFEALQAYGKFRNIVNPKKNRSLFLWTSVSTVAACLLMFVGLEIGLNSKTEAPLVIQTEWNEKSVYACNQEKLLLPDSTVVWLNSESSIIYPEEFIGEERKVFVSGEAYFEVAKDKEHPFIVQSGSRKLTVTGTKFNVKNYCDKYSVTLMEGGVSVEINNHTYLMTPGEMLSQKGETGTVELQEVSSRHYPAWFRGQLNAYDQTFEEIAEDLQHRFGVQILIRNKALADERFSMSFVNGESLDEILNALNFNENMHIIRRENIIDIY